MSNYISLYHWQLTLPSVPSDLGNWVYSLGKVCMIAAKGLGYFMKSSFPLGILDLNNPYVFFCSKSLNKWVGL